MIIENAQTDIAINTLNAIIPIPSPVQRPSLLDFHNTEDVAAVADRRLELTVPRMFAIHLIYRMVG